LPASLLLHHYEDEEYEDEEDVDDDDDGDDGDGDNGAEDVMDYDECSGSNATDQLREDDEKLIPSDDCAETALNAVTEGDDRVCPAWSPSPSLLLSSHPLVLYSLVSLFSFSVDLSK